MADEQVFYIDEAGKKVDPHGNVLENQDPIQAKPEEPQGHSNEPLTPAAQAKEDAKAKADAEAKAKAGK